MTPNAVSRFLRRISASIRGMATPSRKVMASDLAALAAVAAGNEGATAHLAKRYRSGNVVMAAIEGAFAHVDLAAPEFVYVGKGRYATVSGIPIVVDSADGDVQRVTVAGRQVANWKEAVSAYTYFQKNPRLASPMVAQQSGQLQQSVSATFPCEKCKATVEVVDYDPVPECKQCGTEHMVCSDCDKYFDQNGVAATEYGACSHCGHSSWGPDSAVEGRWDDLHTKLYGLNNDDQTAQVQAGRGPAAQVSVLESPHGGILYPACTCHAWASGRERPEVRLCPHIMTYFGPSVKERAEWVNGYMNLFGAK